MTAIDEINGMLRHMEKDAGFWDSVGDGLGQISRSAWAGLGVGAANLKYVSDAVGNVPRMWGGDNWWGDDFRDASWLDYNKAGWRAGQDSAETGAAGLAQGMASTVGINSDTLNNAADYAKSQMVHKGYDPNAVDTLHSGANLSGQIAGEAALIKGLSLAGKPLAASGNKLVRTVGKALPYATLAPVAKSVAGGAVDLADAAVGHYVNKKTREAMEPYKKWLQYGGAGLGGILTFMLASSMLNGNSRSSGSDKKHEESAWERAMKSVLAAGVGAAGVYGGYRLGQTAYDYLYNKHKYEGLMNQIKQTGGEAWNKVKSWFS